MESLLKLLFKVKNNNLETLHTLMVIKHGDLILIPDHGLNYNVLHPQSLVPMMFQQHVPKQLLLLGTLL